MSNEDMSSDVTSNEARREDADYLPAHVNVAEPDAAAYWARAFQVPVERVQEAVAAVGHDPARVASHLGKPWPNAASGIV